MKIIMIASNKNIK